MQVFSGDHVGLERSYEVRYQHDAQDEARWSLTLIPRAAPLSEMLRSLRLAGAGIAVLRIEVREPSGDRTVTSVVGADPEREFSEREKAEFFGIESAESVEKGHAEGKQGR